MDIILRELIQNEAVQSVLQKHSGLGNLSLSEEALIISAAFQQDPNDIIIIKNNMYNAQKLYERMVPFLKDDVMLYMQEESLRIESIAASPENKAYQMETMASLLKDKPKVCIMNVAAATRFVPSVDVFLKHCIHLSIDQEIEFDYLKSLLFEAGYTLVNRVDQPLCYAARGGIIDVYSMNYDQPIRIEFFDNIIESIRFFDVATQRTIETLSKVMMIPATDLLLTDSEIAHITQQVNQELEHEKIRKRAADWQLLNDHIQSDLDAMANHSTEQRLYRYYAYLNNHFSICDYIQHALIFISSKEEVTSSYQHMIEENIAYLQELHQENQALSRYHLFHDLDYLYKQHEVIEFGMFVNYKQPITSQIVTMTLGDVNLERTMIEIIKESKTHKVLLCLKDHEQDQIIKLLNNEAIPYNKIKDDSRLNIGISFIKKDLVEGFTCLKEQICVYTSKELFHEIPKANRYRNKFKDAEVLHDYQELNIGDYVVHNQHGIGKYMGIMNKDMDGVHKDFLKVIYRGDAQLLVPLEQFKLIRKFVSKEGATPKLNSLGSNEWEKTKKKVSEKVAELADRLVKLYATRDEQIGFAYQSDTDMQVEFENDFSYELTKDQKKAVIDIKRDMESAKPMDRLLCGDVGFGKTEVAARAAFKAVCDNKQVAFLCPTTILSLQHYKTFMKRFENFPVTIAVINRFIIPSEQKKIMEGVKQGTIDILIGTHRLLSKDVQFQELGILVIDEEQRFGVEHKEKIKELKNSIDVLSLSATPIPRTLQMSLIGIRSLSQLETPPLNRMPVQTYVIEKNASIIKEIIQRELARHGQVFYLYNNVKDIYNIAAKLRQSLPDIEVGVAHGKMAREDIEDVMLQFTNNKYHVLVCTTIIETGIDIPNANTIIIEDADHFGLSQLYQIKGRVGRSDRLAYAYLMYSPQKQLSEIAMKRLKSIKEFTQLGSGYKIAMRDLTIRGAGDMLGPQQAGFIDTVGIDMYIEMLNEAIMEKKGIKKESLPEQRKTNVKVDAYIPKQFANEDYEKITLYQRMENITTRKDLLLMMEEIEDNYGKLPKSVQLLFEKKRLDILLNEAYIENIQEQLKHIDVTFTANWSSKVDGIKLFEMMTQISKDTRIRYIQNKITMKMPKTKNWLYKLLEILERCEEFLISKVI